MKSKIIELTIDSNISITHDRFFSNERAYQGRLYCNLFNRFESEGLMDNEELIEIEYQKSARHGTSQRLDIIYHIPAEVSKTDVNQNNYAVWALKRLATPKKAAKDFEKLDEVSNKNRIDLKMNSFNETGKLAEFFESQKINTDK